MTDREFELPSTLPLLAVRDIVVFPYMVIPLIVGRPSSMAAVEHALNNDHIIMISCQKNPDVEEPKKDEINTVGTIANILRMIKLPDGKMKILIQGLRRATIDNYIDETPYYTVNVREDGESDSESELLLEARVRHIKQQLAHAVALGKPMLPDLLAVLETITEAGKLADIIAANLGLNVEEAQSILDLDTAEKRLDKVSEFLNKETSILEVQQKIFTDAKGEIDKGQREYFLREQMKAIRRELGEDDINNKEIEEFTKKIKKAKMPKDVKAEAEKQVSKLSKMHHDSAEANVVRSYLDWLTDLPWSIQTEDNLDITNATTVLDEDHYGLEEVKDRILDYLALRKLSNNLNSPIICLVGPPGVGKTSLGKSVARAMGRKFVRMSMGGMRDEAEIRGHRRTYIGALPGKIIQGLKTAGTNNPIFMLDEIDKLGSDFRGDPSSALLEVLDPVQNFSFTDHYLSLPFDLSKVLFITTANFLDPIPAALKDRMEIIRIPGYTEEEKLIIAEKYIVPKQIEENGLKDYKIKFDKAAILEIISGYTRESGLRKLEQLIGKVCRKVGRLIVEKKGESFHITKRSLSKYLGVVDYIGEDELKNNDIGIVTGLAWTPVGGEVLFVECTRFAGKGNMIITGMLGDVMKESSKAALTYIKTIADSHNIDAEEFSKYDYHIHVPAGAIPKDGPSAGITIATAILSVVLKKSVNKSVAMTGEITITGKVLPIGGLKEKLLAAKRIGVSTVIIPKKNEKDIIKLPKYVKSALDIISVETFEEVAKIAIIDL